MAADDDAQSLQEVRAAEDAKTAAARAADSGATAAEAKVAAHDAAATHRLSDEDVDRIADRQIEKLREAGAFDPPETAAPAAQAAAAGGGEGAPAAAGGQGAAPAPIDPAAPESPVPPPRKLSRAEKYAGVDG